MTSQRLKILQELKKRKDHPTAEMIYREVSKDLPSITLATVYRNLNLLAELGQIQRFEINKEYHFDAHNENHQHLVCECCGFIDDIEEKKITDYALKNMIKKDFQVSKVNITYYGLCKKCKEKGEK
jgi:Fur family peroxide stress response transcriptional regulator